MRNCRFVVDPGDGETRTYEISIPANLPITPYAPQTGDYAVFDDAEGTRFFLGDRLQDANCYIFLHPDEEMMQRFIELKNAAEK